MCYMYLSVLAHVFRRYNLAIILIFAVLEARAMALLLLHLVVNWQVFNINKLSCNVVTE